MDIYVGNLPYKVHENDIKGLFENYGTVDNVKIISDKFTGRSKGFGFVTMPNSEEAQSAISNLNESDFQGRNIIVNESRPRS
jgi:RNA recognition motif-containing protein